jgi:hypothetical protein
MPPPAGKFNNALHHRTKSRNSPAPEIIAIRKTTRKYNAVLRTECAQISILMPKHNHFLVQFVLQGILHVSVAVRSWKYNNPKLHIGVDFIKAKLTLFLLFKASGDRQ